MDVDGAEGCLWYEADALPHEISPTLQLMSTFAEQYNTGRLNENPTIKAES
jgi:hypothetical protein